MAKSASALAIVLCGVFLFASVACAELELKHLQGTWVGTETGHEDDGEVTLSIDGEKISFQGWRQDEWYKGTIAIAKDDDRLKLFGTVKECPIAAFIGKTSNGIFRVEGDILTIVARAPGDPGEPEGFDDQRSRRLVLKKCK